MQFGWHRLPACPLQRQNAGAAKDFSGPQPSSIVPPGKLFGLRPDFYGLGSLFLQILGFSMSNFVASGEIFRQNHAQKSCGGRHDFTGTVA